MIGLMRSEPHIRAEYDRLWDLVWWNRHQIHKHPAGRAKAAELEARYGLDVLECDDYELGLRSGRMSALAWVLGGDWESSLDT